MKLRDLVIFNPQERLTADGMVPFIDMAALPQMGRDISGFSYREPASSGSRFVNGDTLLARITPCLENGKGAQVRILPEGSVGQGSTEFIVLRAMRPSDADFVYYVSRHPDFRSHAIRQMTGTSGRQRVAWQSIADFELPNIGPSQRKSIASVLGALDDKIELNRRMNETLEGMARAIFRDWFVDFGPTRAKMDGRAPYLAPDIWSLFPERLDDEGKPEGWEVFRLGELADHHTRTISPSANPGELFEHFSLPAFDKGQNPALDRGATIKSNKTLIPVSAILLSKLNPEIARVWLPEAPTGHTQIASTEFLAYTGKNGVGRGLLFCLFSDDDFRTLLHAMVTGTSKSHQRISPPDLLRREAIIGNDEMFRCFEDVVSPLLDRVLANRSESRTLATTRDFLLPKLMSGEIRVKDAKKLVGEAT